MLQSGSKKSGLLSKVPFARPSVNGRKA
jgi:hypothetical protein